MPALNPNEQLCGVIKRCIELGLSRVVVVNDGSCAEYERFFDEVRELGAHVVRHEKNRGKGAALKTGIRHVLSSYPDAEGVVSADADGQHAPEDIIKVAMAVVRQSHGIVLGSRDFSKGNTPARSRAGNRISAGLFFLMTGMHCRDTQTGLRGIPPEMFGMALETPGERYDYEMNFLIEIARKKLPIAAVPIRTIYFGNNSASHFRTVRDSALVYQRPLKYAAVSLGSGAVDLGLFALLVSLIFGREVWGVWFATAIARCASGFFNYKLNQIWSFKAKKRTAGQFWKYLILFVSVIAVSSISVNLLKFLPVSITLIKAVLDTALFFANYQIQRRWVFADRG
jgi:putative flippase GtrA